MRRLPLFFIIIFYSGLLFGQRISERKLLHKIKNIPQLSRAFIGISISDLDSEKSLASLNEAHPARHGGFWPDDRLHNPI